MTFDNLGEAADLERGLWPEDKPLGNHFSVRRALPRILDLLDELNLQATFFVEGLNATLYPEELRGIAGRGHELGYHGWRHEYWAGLSPDEESRLLEQGVHEMGELGINMHGFRPPGGRLNPATPSLLERLGFTYCSPAGKGAGKLGGIVALPFEWYLIDAYHYLPRFAGLRRSRTGTDSPLPPPALLRTLEEALQHLTRNGGYLALIFHPFLTAEEDRFGLLARILSKIKELSDDGALWCAPGREVAGWILSHPETRQPPHLDSTDT